MMDCYDVIKMQNVTYVQSQTTGALVELEAMKALNQERLSQGFALAYGEEAFINLIDKWQLGHNSVVSNLHGGL